MRDKVRSPKRRSRSTQRNRPGGRSSSSLGVESTLLPGRATHVRNESPHGWWLTSYLERFEFRDAPPRRPEARCLAWENMILIRAKTRDVAFRRAVALAKSKTPGRRGRHGDPRLIVNQTEVTVANQPVASAASRTLKLTFVPPWQE